MAGAPELPLIRSPRSPLGCRWSSLIRRGRGRYGWGVVLAAGRSERLASVTRGGSTALLRLGGLSLVERAVWSLLAAGLERVLVVVGQDAGPVATVVGRLGRGRVRVVYADRWADGRGASLAAVQGEVVGEALLVLVTADHVVGEGGLARLLGAGAPAVLIDPAPGHAGLGGGDPGPGPGPGRGRLWQAPGCAGHRLRGVPAPSRGVRTPAPSSHPRRPPSGRCPTWCRWSRSRST
jgi:CTP:molybdopterin cytidylyltransferase MocA